MWPKDRSLSFYLAARGGKTQEADSVAEAEAEAEAEAGPTATTQGKPSPIRLRSRWKIHAFRRRSVTAWTGTGKKPAGLQSGRSSRAQPRCACFHGRLGARALPSRPSSRARPAGHPSSRPGALPPCARRVRARGAPCSLSSAVIMSMVAGRTTPGPASSWCAIWSCREVGRQGARVPRRPGHAVMHGTARSKSAARILQRSPTLNLQKSSCCFRLQKFRTGAVLVDVRIFKAPQHMQVQDSEVTGSDLAEAGANGSESLWLHF